MHGDEVKSIEASLEIDFGDLVDNMGRTVVLCSLIYRVQLICVSGVLVRGEQLRSFAN
jgi:hypothetical protein